MLPTVTEPLSRSLEKKLVWTFDTEISIKHAHVRVLLSSLQLNTDN